MLAGAGFAAGAPNARIRIGCQARSYFAPVKDRAKILAAMDDMAAAGIEGMECNHLCMAGEFERPDAMRAELARRKLELIGLHVGGRLHDADGAEKARADIDRVARGAKALGASYVVLSPAAIRGLDGAAMQAALHRKGGELNRAGDLCAKLGVRLAVHNHTEETLRGWAEFRMLAEKTNPGAVWFMADIGHSAITGVDPVPFLRDYHARIPGIHVRDHKGEKQVAIGTGTIDYKAVAEGLASRRWAGWVILELEAGGIAGHTKESAVRSGRDYLRKVLGLG